MLLNFRVLLLAALAAPGVAEEALQAGALNVDDECRAEAGEGCGLSALQLRGAKEVPIVGDVIDELEDPDDEIEADEDDEEKPQEAAKEEEQEEAEQAPEQAPEPEEEDTEQDQEQEDAGTTTTADGQPHPEDAVCAQPNEQCGGQWYYGAICCTHGHLCYEVNQYYSKCVTHEVAEELARLENMTTTTTTTTNADPQHCKVGYQQCGGYDEDSATNYSGTTCCHAGFFCKQVDRFFKQCDPVDKNSSFLPYEPSEKLQEPSNATLFTYYVYRAATEDDDYVENINVGDLAGTLWYLHNEVVWVRPRKFGISRILRYKISTRATQPLYELGMNFGVRFSYDAAQCTGPWSCDVNYEKFGYFVGCNNLGMFPFPTWDTHYPNATWYALPGVCSSKAYEDKDPKCKEMQPGGRCEGEPTGQGNCTYSIDLIGSLTIDEIEGIPSYHDFIHMAGEHEEYNKTTDKGVGMTFWDGMNNTAKNIERIERVRMLFQDKYPDQAADVDMLPPTCDFNFEVFYDTTTTTTTTVSTSSMVAPSTTESVEAETPAASTEEVTSTEATSAAPSATIAASTSAAETTEAPATTEAPTTTETPITTAATANESESITSEAAVAATTEAATASNGTTTVSPTTTPAGCEDASLGSHCYSSVIWAMEHGLKLHPTWYPGLTPDSTFAEFQERVHHVTPDVCPVPCTAKAGCHDPVKGESCYSAVKWAMKSGIKKHPHWYPGLTSKSSFREFQAAVHKKLPKKCMMPCPA